MTPKQRQQFNKMRTTLLRISKAYQTVKQLRKSAEKDYGLEPEEVIEMAYENIQNEAKDAVKGVKQIP